MKVKVSWRISNEMLVIFRIMASVKSPHALTVFSVQIACSSDGFRFSHDQYIGFDKIFSEIRTLPHKSFDNIGVALG